MRINTNIPALQSYNALTATNSALQKSINKLSTGLRINSAADDAAGLAISEKMRAQYNGLDQATSNAQDGISMIQTAEGALNETHSILQRMRELSVQAANDTLTQEDRSYIQLEVDQLKEEITRISTTTQFNKKQLLDGSAAALWSSDNLDTRAIINGGLRQIDQFGQKRSVEGNYKITVKANPGEAEIQKSDIFKIKHKNVVMGVVLGAGVENVRVDNMPAGDYKATVTLNAAGAGAHIAANGQAYIANGTTVLGLAADATGQAKIAAIFDPLPAANLVSVNGAAANSTNQTVLLEVTEIEGKNVKLSARVKQLGADGTAVSLSSSDLMVTSGGGITGDVAALNWVGTEAAKIKLKQDVVSGLSVGDKFVFNIAGNGTTKVDVSGTINKDWGEAWFKDPTAATKAAAATSRQYNIATTNVNKEVSFETYYLNENNGTVYESTMTMEFGAAHAAGTTTFEAAYVGQIAKGDVRLRDIDKFWDANGKFMLDDPKTLTVTQGDGKQTNITLYSTDTIEDVRKKMNDAIAFGLGQGKYVANSTNSFVSFVENDEKNTSESVKGTFVIRSLVPGKDGAISFSGDEDVIKAFSLNTIQDSKESQYEVTIVDAHSGNMVASGVKLTGNKLIGVLHENVDITFDAMANINVSWNDDAKKFMLKRSADEYSTILHLADNTTVFQIGANQGEDMGINIGNMSSEALGVANVLVTDRESAARSITVIDNAINKVSLQRAKLGAYQNRLEHTINNLTTASTNLKSSESRIRDADMAKEMMNFTKLNILSSAGNSMLAQANQLPQNVLSLLR